MQVTPTLANSRLPFNVLMLAALLVMVASIISTVTAGAMSTTAWYLTIASIAGLLAANLLEFATWHLAVVMWKERFGAAFVFCLLLGVASSSAVFWVNLTTFSYNTEETAIVQKTAFIKQENNEDLLAAARKRRDQYVKEIDDTNVVVNGKKVTTPGDAEADMRKFEADNKFKATSGCRSNEINTKAQRAFCSDYQAAIQRKDLALKRMQAQNDLAAVEKQTVALSSATSVRAVTHKVDPNIRNIRNAFNVNDEGAERIHAMVIPTAFQIFIIGCAILIAMIPYFGLPRKPWFTGRLTGAISRAWHKFNGSLNVHTTNQTSHIHHDVFGKVLGQRLKGA